MLKLLQKSATFALSVITIVFTFVPEAAFEKVKLISAVSDEVNIILTRILAFIIVLCISFLGYVLWSHNRRKVCINGHNYSIQIEYGDILNISNCKKVINFDECFSTCVGDAPSEVKPSSICGQYLRTNPVLDMQALIDKARLTPARGKSQYQGKTKYESGKLVPNGDYLLMAFAKLDKDGLGKFVSRDEFLDCLSTLWKEIDKYFDYKDVCIPILGSGLTRMDGISGASLSQQELLDIIIMSYKLSSNKIKKPYKLRIVCKKQEGFSLSKISEFT